MYGLYLYRLCSPIGGGFFSFFNMRTRIMAAYGLRPVYLSLDEYCKKNFEKETAQTGWDEMKSIEFVFFIYKPERCAERWSLKSIQWLFIFFFSVKFFSHLQWDYHSFFFDSLLLGSIGIFNFFPAFFSSRISFVFLHFLPPSCAQNDCVTIRKSIQCILIQRYGICRR